MWKRGVLGLSAVTALVLCGLAAAQQNSGNQAAPAAVQYARQQLELAQDGLRQIEEGIERGVISPVDPQYATWSQRVAEAYRATGDVEGSSRALQQHAERLERIVEARRRFQERGAVTELQTLEAQYFLAEARHQLAALRQAAQRTQDNSERAAPDGSR